MNNPDNLAVAALNCIALLQHFNNYCEPLTCLLTHLSFLCTVVHCGKQGFTFLVSFQFTLALNDLVYSSTSVDSHASTAAAMVQVILLVQPHFEMIICICVWMWAALHLAQNG